MIMEVQATLSPVQLNLVSPGGTFFFFFQIKATFYNDPE